MATSTTFLAVGCPQAHNFEGIVDIYHLDSVLRDGSTTPMLEVSDSLSFRLGSQIQIMEFNHMQNYIFLKKSDANGF